MKGKGRSSQNKKKIQTWNKERCPPIENLWMQAVPLSHPKKQEEEGNPKRNKGKMKLTNMSSVARSQQSSN